MKILAIETSTRSASIALADEDGALLAEKPVASAAEELLAATGEALADTATSKREIGLVAVSSGPGFFTSLKVGAAAAKTLAYVLNIPVAPVPSLEVLASNVRAPSVCSLIDAQGGRLYCSFFSVAEKTQRKSEDMILSPEEICAKVTDRVVFVADASVSCADLIRSKLGELADFAPPALSVPKASVCAALGLRVMSGGGAQNAFSFSPDYLRKDPYSPS